MPSCCKTSLVTPRQTDSLSGDVQTDRQGFEGLVNIHKGRCAKLDINPCHQNDMSNKKEGLNPVFVLGAVMDKAGISISWEGLSKLSLGHSGWEQKR